MGMQGWKHDSLVPHTVEGITDETADKQGQERQIAVSRKEAVSFEVHSRERLEVPECVSD